MSAGGFRPATVLLRLSAGFIVWSAHFLAIYVFAAVACAAGFADRELVLGIGIVPAMIALLTLLALLANGAIVLANRESRPGELDAFVRWFAIGVAVLASVGIVLDALPAAILDGCR